MKTLTTRQREVLDYIKAYLADEGYPPTRREIAEAFSFASPNASSDHLLALESKGAIRLRPNVPRGIKVLAVDTSR